MIKKIELKKFTVFEDLALEFTDGINVLVGENAVGKTHVMKVMYSAMSSVGADASSLLQKINGVFRPDAIHRLIHRQQGNLGTASLRVTRQDPDSQERYVRVEINRSGAKCFNMQQWSKGERCNVAFLPVKDMLANAPGFISAYNERISFFEEIYPDIVSKALLMPLKGHSTSEKKALFAYIQDIIGGTVIESKEHFYLKSDSGKLEFSLLAEGYRKLGLIYTLIQNGTLSKGGVVFWDEPEANLNPKLAKDVAKLIVMLNKFGVQVFIATHDYLFAKELEYAVRQENREELLNYYSFYSESESIKVEKKSKLSDLEHCAINEAYDQMLVKSLLSSM